MDKEADDGDGGIVVGLDVDGERSPAIFPRAVGERLNGMRSTFTMAATGDRR